MLAVLEYRQGNCAGAASHFEKAGELINSERDALHAYATCLVRGKKIEQAQQVFVRAVALNPEDPHERRVLAFLPLLRSGEDTAGLQSPPQLVCPRLPCTK